MSEKDPITLVYEKIWEILESGTRIQALVKEGNRIKLNDWRNRAPFKERIAAGDLPELTIISVNGNVHLNKTTTGSMFTQRFRIVISSGEQRIDPGIFPVKFAVISAMADWVAQLATVVWKGEKIAPVCRMLDFVDGLSDTDLNRGILGWSTLMLLEVEMYFDTLTLIAEK